MIESAAAFVGQPLARRLLEGYLRKGRIAGTFLFLGERGLGKTTLASIFARAIVCENNKVDPKLWFCGECYACRTIAAGEQPEYVTVRPHGKQISVERVEEDTGGFNTASYFPTLLSHRIFHIEEAHQLNQFSGNQMLKLLEEPPEGTVFLLDTDKPDMLLPTIRSRGNPIRLTSISPEELSNYVRQNYPELPEAQVADAIRLGGGRFVETVLLARNQGWSAAIRTLAQAIADARRIPEAAAHATDYGVEALWIRELEARGLNHDTAEVMIKSAASSKDGTAENQLRKRKTELARESLIASYSYALALLLKEGRVPVRVLSPFAKLKQRINQNVDQLLAQVAFENSLR